MDHLPLPTVVRSDSIESSVTLVSNTRTSPVAGSESDSSALRYRSRSPSPNAFKCVPLPPYPLACSGLPNANIAIPQSLVESSGSGEAYPNSTCDIAILSRTATPFHAVATPAALHNCAARPALDNPGRFKFTPTSPQELLDRRYKQRCRISKEELERKELETVPAFETSFKHDRRRSDPWVPMKHPEGQLYYRKTLFNNVPVYTDLLLDIADNLQDIEMFASSMSSEIQANMSHLPDDIEIALDIRRDDSQTVEFCYYAVSVSKRAVFWLEETQSELITLGLRPVYDKSYLRIILLMSIIDRLHIGLFPIGRPVSAKLLDEVNEQLDFITFDAKTSDASTSPYSHEDVMILSNSARNLKSSGGAAAIWIIARIMYILYWEKFLHFHGQREARLDRQESIYDVTPHVHSWAFLIVSPLLFYMPNRYAEQLNKIWVDQTVNHVPWKKFVAGLQRDWQNSITPATVLLTANVGLLAVNTIDTPGPRNVAEIASYISTFLSLGNIILCTILARQHDSVELDTATGAAEYLYRRTTLLAGIDLIAITFSLPSALFLWGMGTFYIAMGWVCFDGSNVWTRFLTGTFFVLVTLLTAAVICVELWPADQSEYSAWQRLLARIRGAMQAKSHPLKGRDWKWLSRRIKPFRNRGRQSDSSSV